MASLNDSGSDVLLEQPHAEGLILGLPLAEPEHDPVSLPLHFSEQVFTGSWLVGLPDDAVGPWLLYTSAESPLHSRATIVPPTASQLSKPLTRSRGALRRRWRRAHAPVSGRAAPWPADPQADDWQTLELLLIGCTTCRWPAWISARH